MDELNEAIGLNGVLVCQQSTEEEKSAEKMLEGTEKGCSYVLRPQPAQPRHAHVGNKLHNGLACDISGVRPHDHFTVSVTSIGYERHYISRRAAHQVTARGVMSNGSIFEALPRRTASLSLCSSHALK